MRPAVPTISVGLPVYNAEQFVAEAIESILAQTYTDFELIIVDNCSTDFTPSICTSYASQDSRVRYYRNDTNIGAGPNHTRAFEHASGTFFKWHSADDRLAPTFLAKCIDEFTRQPDIVLCHCWTELMDPEGNVVGRCPRRLRTDSAEPGIRWREITWYDHQCYQIYGLMRRTDLAAVGGLGCYIHGDGITLARMALLGRFHEIPEPLFFSRKHPAQSGQTLPYYANNGRRRLFNRVGPKPPIEWWDPSRLGRPGIPEARMLYEYSLSILRSPVDIRHKAECLSSMIPWMAKHFPRLITDIAIYADVMLDPILNWKPVQKHVR